MTTFDVVETTSKDYSKVVSSPTLSSYQLNWFYYLLGYEEYRRYK